jgi:hypothetical protein
MSHHDVKALPGWVLRLRLGALVVLVASVPLGGWIGVPVPGTVHQHEPARLAVFDVLIWPALALVLLARYMRSGPRGVLEAARRVPLAACFLVLLAAWAGLVWPRLAGAEPPGLTALAKKMVPLLEYGLAAFVVFGELVDDEKARRLALGTLSAAFGVLLVCAAVHYFSSCHPFWVGGFLGSKGAERNEPGTLLAAVMPYLGGNRNALGAFLAVAVPFFAVVAVRSKGWEWRAMYGTLAAVGVLLATTAGAILGLALGTLLGCGLAGRRQGLVACGALAALLALGELLPRHNLGQALDSVRVTRKDAEGTRYLSVRYLRAGYEVNVVRAGLRRREPGDWRYLFGVGPGAYGRDRQRFRLRLDERPPGETDKVENFDVLSDEPESFNLFGVAAAETGLLGVFGFAWLLACFAARALSAWRRPAGGALAESIALGALAAAVGALVVSPFTSVWIRGSGPLLAMLVAVCSRVNVSDGMADDTPPSQNPPSGDPQKTID